MRDRQFVASCGATDGFRVRSVVDAEGAFAIGSDVRVQPRDAFSGVCLYDLADEVRTELILWNVESFRKMSLDQVAGHGDLLYPAAAGEENRALASFDQNRRSSPSWPDSPPKLGECRTVTNLQSKLHKIPAGDSNEDSYEERFCISGADGLDRDR